MRVKHTFNAFILLATFGLLLIQLNEKVYAQEVDNVDEAYLEAQELAFDGKRAEARELAYAILEISPEYHDVRILIARTYSWDERYMDARRELEIVLDHTPDYRDALMASMDNERWAENYNAAKEVADRSTRLYPIDVEILLKSANVYYNAGDERTTLRLLDRVDQLSPSNRESADLRKNITLTSQNYTLSGSYSYDWYSVSDAFDPSQISYLQLTRRSSIGTFMARLNYADRFNTTGLQPEIDFYPNIADGWYGYLNFGVADSFIFPRYRTGAELHKIMPKGFEVSAGFRFLKFQNADVIIYTGTLTKYQGSWLFTIRPYFTPSSGVGWSRSVNMRARKFLGGPDNYITFRGGFGFSPEERRLQDGSGNVLFVQSQFLGIELFKSLRNNLALFSDFDVTRQELSFSPGDFTRIYTLRGGIQVKF